MRAKVYCCVPFCSSRKDGIDKTVSFHSIPKNPESRAKWITKIRRDEGVNFKIGKNTKVCSQHFGAQDFRPLLHTKLRLLKLTAVPTIFQWNRDSELARQARSNLRLERRTRRAQRKMIKIQLAKEVLPEPNEATTDHDYAAPTRPDYEVTTDPDFEVTIDPDKKEKKTEPDRDNQVQKIVNPEDGMDVVTISPPEQDHNMELKKEIELLNHKLAAYKSYYSKSRKLLLRFENITDDNVMRFYTGLPNVSTAHSLLTYLKPKTATLQYWRGKKTMQKTIRKPRAVKPGFPCSINVENQFFLTLLRLKLGMPVKELSRIYCVAHSTISRIFTTWVNFLYTELKDSSQFPSAKIIWQCIESSCFSSLKPCI